MCKLISCGCGVFMYLFECVCVYWPGFEAFFLIQLFVAIPRADVYFNPSLILLWPDLTVPIQWDEYYMHVEMHRIQCVFNTENMLSALHSMHSSRIDRERERERKNQSKKLYLFSNIFRVLQRSNSFRCHLSFGFGWNHSSPHLHLFQVFPCAIRLGFILFFPPE